MQVDTRVPKAALPGGRVGAQLLPAAVGAAGLQVVQAAPDGVQVGVWLQLGAALHVAAAPGTTPHARAGLVFSHAGEI